MSKNKLTSIRDLDNEELEEISCAKAKKIVGKPADRNLKAYDNISAHDLETITNFAELAVYYQNQAKVFAKNKNQEMSDACVVLATGYKQLAMDMSEELGR